MPGHRKPKNLCALGRKKYGKKTATRVGKDGKKHRVSRKKANNRWEKTLFAVHCELSKKHPGASLRAAMKKAPAIYHSADFNKKFPEGKRASELEIKQYVRKHL